MAKRRIEQSLVCLFNSLKLYDFRFNLEGKKVVVFGQSKLFGANIEYIQTVIGINTRLDDLEYPEIIFSLSFSNGCCLEIDGERKFVFREPDDITQGDDGEMVQHYSVVDMPNRPFLFCEIKVVFL